MAYMEWQPALEIGHPQIDAEHRSLVETLNRLHRAVDQGRDHEEIEQVLVFLRDYTVTHFAAEEALMIRHQYPGASAHFTAHVNLVMQVSDLLAAFRAGQAVLTESVLVFLEGWLLDHIQGLDKEFAGFLNLRSRPA
jgi:hemerythrin-like metal-binding protein